MDRWKTKELKQMELGGNKNARAFYEENGMFTDGKPDHEHALHSRYKMELAAKAEVIIREEIQSSSKFISHFAKTSVTLVLFSCEYDDNELYAYGCPASPYDNWRWSANRHILEHKCAYCK